MIIKMILATDDQYGIGYNNRLPWHIPEELKFFRTTTRGHSVVMGKNTYESIGKPLPNRKNYIITRSNYPEVETISNIDTLISKYKDSNETLFVIGGSKIYSAFSLHADEIIWSKIKGEYQTDIKIDKSIFNRFEEVLREELSDIVSIRYLKFKKNTSKIK